MRALAAVVLTGLFMAPLAGSAPSAGPKPISIAWKGPEMAVTTRAGLYLVDPVSGARRLLTRKADSLEAPDWAPDGQTLAFLGRDLHLYTIRGDGSALHRLGKGLNPSWSPDGRRIAFFRNGVGLFVMNASGTGAHQIVRDRYNLTGQAAWSPNGKTLAYIACTAAYLSQPCEHLYGFDVYTIPVAGGKKHRISRKSGLPSCVQWSSRGRLSYTSLSTGQRFVVLVRGSVLKQLPLRGCAVWAPDGRHFATGNGSFGPIVVKANGGGAHQLHVLKSKTFSIAAVDWAPDSHSLGYLTEAGGGSNARLFRVDLNGLHKRLLP